MVYATEFVEQYRRALRELWNTYFWGPEPFRDYASVRQLDRLKLPLFCSLVLDRLGSDLPYPEAIFGPPFKLVPLLRNMSGIHTLMIERPEQLGIWEPLSGPFIATDIEIHALDYFDWMQQGFKDFRFYLARIVRFTTDMSIEGARALVDVYDVDVLWDPPGILNLPRR